LENIAKKEEKAEIFVHLGDTEPEVSAFMRKHPSVDFRYVRGNNDYNSTAPTQLVVDVPGARIFCVHGNRHGVYYGVEKLTAIAANLNCNVACFGHTHRYFQDYIDGIHVLNPGSCAKPRDSLVPSYAFIDVTPAGIVIGKKDITYS
jgi:putative phosphoesterase